MKYQGRVSNWLGASLLVGLAAALSSACGSSDDGAKSYCDTLVAKERECGILSEGKLGCVNYNDAAEPCEIRCLQEASCANIVANNCGSGGETNAIAICNALCVGLQPVTCGDGSKLSGYLRCDGFMSCSDGADEADCTVANSGFKCRNVNQFIPGAKNCDGTKDCPDGSDERADCAPGPTCKVGGTDTQLGFYSTCDGVAECDDKSDEPAGCVTLTCPN